MKNVVTLIQVDHCWGLRGPRRNSQWYVPEPLTITQAREYVTKKLRLKALIPKEFISIERIKFHHAYTVVYEGSY